MHCIMGRASSPPWADRSGKLRYKSMKTRRAIESLTMAITEAEGCLQLQFCKRFLKLKIPGELKEANLLVWRRFKRDRESRARKTMAHVCLHRI